MPRFILEGEWSGYISSQQRVVHRQVVTKPDRYKALRCIRYSDGTCLYLSVRPCKPREKVVEMRWYSSLIEDCLTFNVDSVDAIDTARKECQEARRRLAETAKSPEAR